MTHEQIYEKKSIEIGLTMTKPQRFDGHSTTYNWQEYSGGLCILPVGSFEQHSHHLPLATDNIVAEYFARALADELPAALLPVLPFGTAMEHTGFRGSVSLRPETLMQIIRDIAGEMERQNFEILILLNGHGGNFSLGPVARDWNRRDRKLKILLLSWGELRDFKGDALGLDVHAGEGETSVMMALRPDLVGTPREELSPPDEAYPLQRPDLNTFGAGHFSRDGAIGSPSLATAEKGEAIIASAKANLAPYVRDRIERLRRQPRYAGAGGLTTRILSTRDLPAASNLASLAGWNQTGNDWRLFLEESADGCFAAVHNGQVEATVTTIRYGQNLAWIGMMLVHPQFRRLGLGRMLMEKALQHLSNVPMLKLDATPAGQPLYEQLGFVAEAELYRWTHSCLPPLSPEASATEPVKAGDIPSLGEFDRKTFGAPRERVLHNLYSRSPQVARRVLQTHVIEGFCLGRDGANFHQVGPVDAVDFETARAVTLAAFQVLSGRSVVLDVPVAQSEYSEWLQSLGFVRQRPLMRMVKGSQPESIADTQFAIAGPELG